MITRFIQEDFNNEFDVIIIGGGINGSGIARDAASRGLSVLLLEKEDFGYGCTSASTRLIHGGLRYLEYFEFDLVRESLREREILLKNASHLVKPLELCIPVYKNSKRSFFEINVGMVLYDLLSFDKSLPSYKSLSREEFINIEPSVCTEGLVGAVLYYDAQAIFPERICVENALMASKLSAKVLNHAEVVDFNVVGSKIDSIIFKDTLSKNKFTVRGKQVVNVSGPWVDKLCELSGKSIKRKVGGTKGTHIVVNKSPKFPNHAIYASAKSDDRPFFIIPWNGLILIGTTDTYFDGDLDSVLATDSEIEYLISETNNLLPKCNLIRDDILYSYSGVRPLPYVSNVKPGAITRKHIIFDHDVEGISNLISVIGGKLTTYRSLSEQAVDILFKKLKIKKIKSTTKNVHFLDSQTYKDLSAYDPSSEYAYTVSDVLLRRSFEGLNYDLGMSALITVEKLLKNKFNYTDEEIELQVKEYKNTINLRRV